MYTFRWFDQQNKCWCEQRNENVTRCFRYAKRSGSLGICFLTSNGPDEIAFICVGGLIKTNLLNEQFMKVWQLARNAAVTDVF